MLSIIAHSRNTMARAIVKKEEVCAPPSLGKMA